MDFEAEVFPTERTRVLVDGIDVGEDMVRVKRATASMAPKSESVTSGRRTPRH